MWRLFTLSIEIATFRRLQPMRHLLDRRRIDRRAPALDLAAVPSPSLQADLGGVGR